MPNIEYDPILCAGPPFVDSVPETNEKVPYVLYVLHRALRVGCDWALMGSFEHSNRELLALYICRDMAVFVVLCVGFSLCYVQSLVCDMCSL